MRPDRPAVAAARVALAERLVGLVDEHHAAAERADQPEDLLEVAFARADPAIAEILELDHRHAGFAGEALDQEGLAGADRAAQQIAHRQRLEIAGAPQRDVLAQPGLERFLAVVVVERALATR